MTARPRSETPKERKVTARFTAEELEALAEQARRRGDTLSSLVRDLVVETLDEVQRNLEESRR